MTGAEVTKKLLTINSIAILLSIVFLGRSFAETDKTSQIILRVSNLSCNDCHGKINSGLQQLDNNIRMSSGPGKRSLIISYPNTLKDQEVVRTIQRLGYKVGITNSQNKNGELSHIQKGSKVTYGYCTSTCSASSSTWEQFYKRYFVSNK